VSTEGGVISIVSFGGGRPGYFFEKKLKKKLLKSVERVDFLLGKKVI
jgi:hypothetical protein